MDKLRENELKIKANLIRQDIVKMIGAAGSGHPAGSLGMADIFSALYFEVLNHDPKKPMWEERDRLILSNGHIVPVRYAAMVRSGYFPVTKLRSFRKFKSQLQGHPSIHDFPEMECSGGPLGQGISLAVGMALAAKIDKAQHHIFCVTSDGEHNEGQVWEALMLANKYRLGNLINIIDYNRIQIDGYIKDIMPLGNLKNKYQSFGWKMLEMDGHNISQIIRTLTRAKSYQKSPVAVIAKITPGKGVKFMENKYQWHGKAPNEKQAQLALEQLKNYD